MHKKNSQGFSLLELLVSASIIAILTVIGVVSYSSVNKRSRDVKRKSDVEQIRSALEMYRSDNGSYPDANAGSWGPASALNTYLVTQKYTPIIPSDPQDPTHSYYYAATNEDVSTSKYYGYCICSYLETAAKNSTCVADDIPGRDIPGACLYGLKNP